MNSSQSKEERRKYREWMNRVVGFCVVGFMSTVAAAIFAPESVSNLFLFAGLGLAYIGFLEYITI